MKMFTVFFLAAFLGLVAVISCQDFGEVYCGRRLATALAFLCDNNLIKRSGSRHRIEALDSTWPWIAPHRAHGMSRSKRQVVSECCDKPCTIDELLSYCGK